APADTIAPSTVADVTPEPPATRWNNSTVTVRLNATDNPGGAVRDLHYAFTGAHAEPAAIVSGGALPRSIGEEGSTTVTFFASDFVGNAETPQTRTVNIDRTNPVIAGMPAADCVLWPPDGAWRHVATVSAVDRLSGIAADSFQLRIESSETTGAESGDAVRVVVSGRDTRDVWLRAKRDGKNGGRPFSIPAPPPGLAGKIPPSP